MDLSTFGRTWRAIRAENMVYRLTLPVLVLCLVIALMGWLSKDRVTVLVPPSLSETTSVAKRNADAGYKKAWAVNVAGLLGNISPGNADFVMESLQVLMAPAVYNQLQSSIASDVTTIKADGVTISFEQRAVYYERQTDKVFVTGRSGVSGSAGPIQKFDRTFEMVVTVDDGHPQITSLSSYPGPPKTLEVLKNQRPASGANQ